MGAPFFCIDIICKGIYGFCISIVVLKGYFNDNVPFFTGNVYRFGMDRGFIFVQVFDKRYNSTAIMEFLFVFPVRSSDRVILSPLFRNASSLSLWVRISQLKSSISKIARNQV